MANNQNADGAKFIINGQTPGNKVLRKVKSVKETDSRDAEHVYNTFDKKPTGVARKPGGGELELEVYEEKGTPEVDWEKLQALGEFFSITREVIGGRRTQFVDCTVANVAASSDDSHQPMMAVKVLWSERKKL
jgi:hypothetical protein